MFKPLPLFIALRYVGAKHNTHFFSFVSIISLLGLTLGVAALIIVLSVMNGFEGELKKRILGSIPHAIVQAQQPIQDELALEKKIQQLQPSIQATAPLTQAEVMLSFQGRVIGAQLSGIDPIEEAKVSNIENFMQYKKFHDLTPNTYHIILGAGLASELNIHMGDTLMVILPQLRITPFGSLPRYRRFTVMDIFEVGAEPDHQLAFAHREDVGRLIGLPAGSVQSIRLKYSDVFDAPAQSAKLQSQLNPASYHVEDWSKSQGQFFKAVHMERRIVALLLSLIILVAGFNMLSGLMMLVTEKRTDIAILQTLGLTPSQIKSIFILQGLFLGIGGTLVGIILGVIGALNISGWIESLQQLLNSDWFSAYYLNYLPSELQLSDVLSILMSALLLTFIGVLYPAHHAAKIQPAEVLRYE